MDRKLVPSGQPRDESPNSSSTTRLTPDSDSEDSDFNDSQHGESYKLKNMPKDLETHDGGRDDSDGESEEETIRRRPRRASASTTQSFQLYTPDEERAVVRKFDKKLVLFVALLYMLSFLDRSNIGNARIAGLERDLHLDDGKYEWVLTAFYIAYICFEWMSILWKIVPAHIYVTSIVLSWGIIASLQSIAPNFTVLIFLRFLLGVGEAGFTGIPFYLSFFFKREELALRTGYFISAAPLATSFASTLAWAIIKLGHYLPIASWRLLFLIEGFPSVLVAVVAWHKIPDSPSTASYLTTREKRVARLRLRKQKDAKLAPTNSGLNIGEMVKTILDPKSYITAFMFFCTNMAFSSMPVFLPTIIKDMGHSTLVSQLLSAPPYLLSFFVVVITALLSDKLQNRSYFIIFHALLSASGYGFLALAGKMGWGVWWRYAAIYPSCMGFFSVITIIITWTINNQESESGQGMGFAMLQLIGQCGPLVGTRLYPEKDAPLFVNGMGVCAGAMVMVAFLALGLRFYLGRKNRGARNNYGELGAEAEGEGRTLVAGGEDKIVEAFQYML